MFENTLFYFYRNFSRYKILHSASYYFYLFFLIPTLRFLLNCLYKNIVLIKTRNSLHDANNFNVFLSDIDLTIVIKNDSDYLEIVKTIITFKKIFLMIDLPEIYFENEYLDLIEIQKSKQWGFVNTLWLIRKVNWNNASIAHKPTPLNIIKKERSNSIALSKILNDPKIKKDKFILSDFIFFNSEKSFSIQNNSQKNICFYSLFLETNSSKSIQLLLDNSEFESFNSLMPTQDSTSLNAELKIKIATFELLITHASLRLDEALGKTNVSKSEWIEKLEFQIDLLS